MRILIVNTLYYPNHVGGAEISVQYLAEELVSSGHEVFVICLHDQKKHKEITHNGVHIHYLPLDNIYWPYTSKSKSFFSRLVWHIIDSYNIMAKSRINSLIMKIKPDIVHTNNLAGFSVSVIDAIKANGIKVIHTARDYYLFHPNSTLFKNGTDVSPKSFAVKLWSYIRRKKISKVDFFVGISDFISNFHKENGFIPYASHVTIYNPITPVTKKKSHTQTNKIVLGYIGKLSQEKGFIDFCSFASCHKNKKIKFIAAGRCSDKDKGSIASLSLESGVDIVGFIKLEEFVSMTDIAVLPVKWNEPFGRTVAECAISGIPVYTNFKGGVSELSLLCKNIYEVEKFEEASLTKVLDVAQEQIIDNPFEPHRHSKKYEAIFRGLILKS